MLLWFVLVAKVFDFGSTNNLLPCVTGDVDRQLKPSDPYLDDVKILSQLKDGKAYIYPVCTNRCLYSNPKIFLLAIFMTS